jgi:hypothetical protein
MKHNKEFDTSYFHNPVVQGANYSLFIMLLKEMVLMESKGRLGAAPATSTLLSSQSSDQFCVFCVSLPPHREIARGVPYIVGFRSRQIRRIQNCVERTHEDRDGPHHMARKWAHMGGPLAPCRVPC